ncbi:MAG: hypothetical protein KGS61_05610 [Verrucomicrobia bacterium]|nr:hypothetical protein [Verrucomicrobiota bacterium]
MASISVSGSTPRSNRHLSVLVPLALLTAVLVVIFNASFRPDRVLFSNDGPLGALTAYSHVATTFFTGAWHDLNWLGNEEPSVLPNITFAFYFLLGPLGYAKFFVPIALLILGLSAWLLFRQLGFRPWICVLGALAAALNMDSFSYACWGLPSVALAPAMVFLALAAIHSAAEGRSPIKLALAGMAVGMAVMEAFDVGAIFSLYVAAFTFFLMWAQAGPAPRRIARGVGRVALVAGFAGLLAAQALSTLIQTQIQGVVGMQQDEQTREERWDQATQWSLPKLETLRLIVPGLFGYRMDTPGGGQYWGAVGQDPAVPGLLQELAGSDERARTQAMQQLRVRLLRHSGSGEYAGVLVMLLAAFALAQSLRSQEAPYSALERRCVWFWSGAALVSLLLAFGRHAPFYRLVYALPYFSTIRNPVKFLHPLHLSLVILFGYGLAALHRLYLAGAVIEASGTAPSRGRRGLATAPDQSGSILEQVRDWWQRAGGFDRRWVLGMGAALGASLLGWLIYAASRTDLIGYLERTGFGEASATAIAGFSLGEVGFYLLLLGLSVAAVVGVMSGRLSGARAKWTGLVLGALLVVDLARANAPWIVYYNYREKYASNPVVDFLRERPYEKRVTALRFNVPAAAQSVAEFFQQLYYGDWVQHLFQYYRVQSLDLVQMPREKRDYEEFMVKTFPAADVARQGRLWQLTSTRYLLGLAGFTEELNRVFDPVKRRFRTRTGFTFKQSADSQLEMVVNTNGPLALIEDGAALPRASLFTRWQVSTNDAEMLQRLVDPAFDPEQTVLVADRVPAPGPTNADAHETAGPLTSALSLGGGEGEKKAQGQHNLLSSAGSAGEGVGKAGAVTFSHYEPKFIQFEAQADRPSVLLFNDRFDPNWKVRVDGRPEKLLRCNYLMRGVYLEPGRHTVEFRFQPPVSTLWVSLATLGLGVVCCGLLAFAPRSKAESESREAGSGATRS